MPMRAARWPSPLVEQLGSYQLVQSILQGSLFDGTDGLTRSRASWWSRGRGRSICLSARSAGAPVSADFPVKQGKNREFLQNHPLIRPIGPSNTLVSRIFSVEFPKHRNREFFSGTGNLIRGTGNYLGGSGNNPAVRRSFKLGACNPRDLTLPSVAV